MRLWPVLALVLGCGCGQGRHDVQLAKATVGGVQLVVRRTENRIKRPCREEGINLYKCLLVKPDKTGCVYIDIGEPLPVHAGDNPCTPGRPGRRLLLGSPEEIDFEVDPAGERVAWRVGTAWQVGYVVEHQLLIPTMPYFTSSAATTKSTAAIDWRALKSLEDAAPQLYFEAPPELQPVLLKRMRAAGGDRPVTAMLISRPDVASSPAWDPAYQTLDQTHRQQVVAALEKSVFEDGLDDPIAWFDANPEAAPKDFEARLRQRALESAEDSELEPSQRWLVRGYRHRDPVAPKVACQVLEQRALWSHWGEGEYGGEPDAMPYAVIAATQSKCPAVQHALGDSPCSPELRCGHGWAPGDEPENVPATRTDTGDPWDLCDAADLEQLKRALEQDDGRESYGDFDAAAKMNALLAQGPLSKSFQLKAARRNYRQVFVGDGGEPDGTPCDGDHRRLSEFLCELRPDQTRFSLYGCQVEIDDEKKRVRLWRPDEQDGGR